MELECNAIVLCGDEVLIDTTGKSRTLEFKIPMDYFMNWFSVNYHKSLRINFKYGNKKYLSDLIPVNEAILLDTSDKSSKNWNPKRPVIISAQTGKGKNHFIFYGLLKKLIERFPDKNDYILFLSNRIATNRQSKIQVSELLTALIPDDKYKRKIEEIFTSKGIDEYCVDFEKITICTYHQMYEQKLLSKKHFQYIICDECHFFTSDGIFNPETNNILKEIVTQGKDSIRIYMSATIEVVFEAIVREEFSKIESERDSVINEMRNKNFVHQKEIYYETTYENNLIMENITKDLANMPHIERHRRLLWEKNWGIRYPYSEEEIKKIYDSYFLEIDFYYMPRNYDYLEKIIPYETNDELIEHIKQSKGKWIIFVHSENEGKRLENELTKKNVVNSDDCIFISRPVVKLEGKGQIEYDFIIANEKTNKRIVITTSILDNGINIKNSEDDKQKNKILNIAIDSYDRTQFIQMLGRVRDNQKDKIKLYIKKYSLEDLKKNIRRDTEELILRLVNPLRSKKEKQNNFNDKYFYYTEDSEVFSDYNPCAIYQLIDQITRNLRIIRKSDENFFIEVSDNLDALKEKVYHYYKNELKWSIWGRSIIEILDTETHHKTIEGYQKEDMRNGIYNDVYDLKLNNTFTRFLFSKIIPQYLFSIIEDRYTDYLKRIDSSDFNYYNGIVINKLKDKPNNNKVSYYTQAFYLYCKCEILIDVFEDKYEDVSIDFIEKYIEKIKHYEDLADDDKFCSLFDEQLRWIEQYSDSCDIETENIINIEKNLDEFIQSHAITNEELKKNIHLKKDGTNSKHVEKDFLENHGILKDSDQANELSNLHFNGKDLSNCIGQKIILDEKVYILKSAISRASGHKTYYLFIKVE